MKKIIAMAVAAVMMVSAASALDLEFGARGILGRNLNLNEDFKTNFQEAKQDQSFDYGFGVYGNFALFGGLGIQAEANYITSHVDFVAKKANEDYEPIKYDVATLDLAPMLWLNLDLWKFTVGLGVGPNFSIQLASLSEIKTAQKDQFKPGLIAGADFKFYFTDHLGLVLSGRYVAEWEKRNATISAYGQEVETPLPEYSFNRKTIYGGVGLEFKLL
jgi:hypothetical protein